MVNQTASDGNRMYSMDNLCHHQLFQCGDKQRGGLVRTVDSKFNKQLVTGNKGFKGGPAQTLMSLKSALNTYKVLSSQKKVGLIKSFFFFFLL
jgi:hypothetical protein